MTRVDSVRIMLALLLLLASYRIAKSAQLEWDLTHQESSVIYGFKIYYGTTSHSSDTVPVDDVNAAPYDTVVDIADPLARSYTVAIPPGGYYFRVTVYGSLEEVESSSGFSEEVFASHFVGPSTPEIVSNSASSNVSSQGIPIILSFSAQTSIMIIDSPVIIGTSSSHTITTPGMPGT